MRYIKSTISEHKLLRTDIQRNVQLEQQSEPSGAQKVIRLLNRRLGFTLIETVIAMALIGLIIAGAFSVIVSSYATMRRTEENLYVNRLLETAIEMTRNLSFADIAGDPANGIVGYASTSPVKFSTKSTLLTDKHNNILYNKGVADPKDPSTAMDLSNGAGNIYFQKLNDNLYKVTATVTWTPFRLSSTSRSITTYIAKDGIDKR